MATNVTTGVADQPNGWTPARFFLAASAGYHLLLGIAGLTIDQTFPLGPNATEQAGSEFVFGIFETNGWHSVAAVLVAVVSLYFLAMRPEHARPAALAIGFSQALVVVAFTLFPPSVFSFASNGADQVIHSITAIWGIGSALLTPRLRPSTSPRTAQGVT